MSSDLSALLTASKSLTSHLSRAELPSVHLSLHQVEAQSRRLVSRQPGPTDIDRANYLLAQAHVDASALSDSIAHLNTSTTFAPLHPLQDTDISGYLRHAHEQNLISAIEEGRKETQEEFYRALEEKSHRDWEAKKQRVLDEISGRISADNLVSAEIKKTNHGRGFPGLSVPPNFSLQMQTKMLAYDQVVADFNRARIRGTSYPIFNALINTALTVTPNDSKSLQLAQNFHILAKITGEPTALPPIEHAGAHILNAPIFEHKYSRLHFGDVESREASSFRRQIAKGGREALEEQYWDVIERTIQARPTEARLGGDPSVSNKVRAFLFVRYYRNGEWESQIELVTGQPLWARLYLLIRTGHVTEAISEIAQFQDIIQRREPGFAEALLTWLESSDRKLPKPHRDQLQAIYNAQMLHSAAVDPFKLAIYKLMGRIEPSRRNVPSVTTTTEDWMWFQLAMVDEEEEGGLRSLSELLLGYGERHFEFPEQNDFRRGIWAGVLLMCGQFERAVAALWEHQETEIEAVHLAIALAYYGLLRVPSRAETSDMTPLSLSSTLPPALSLSTIIWRYVRQFVKFDPKEALQYVYCVCLTADQGDVGKDQIEITWEQVRRIITLCHSGPAWEELIGGYRQDGTKFSGMIEHGAALLHLEDSKQFKEQILVRSAQQCEQNDRIAEAIKLYNVAGEYITVMSCLANSLSSTIAKPTLDDKDKLLERTAVDIVKHYESTNRAAGRDRDAVTKLLSIRGALEAKTAGKPEIALDMIESTGLIPLSGDVAKITRRAEEFKDLHESLQRNLQTYLTLTLEALVSVHSKVKSSVVPESARQLTIHTVRRKSRSLMIFAGMLKYRMPPDMYSYLARLDVEIAL